MPQPPVNPVARSQAGGATSIVSGGNPIGSVNAALTRHISDVLKTVSSTIGDATVEGARFIGMFNDAVQPVITSVTDLGRSVEQLGYLGMALDSKDRLGISKVAETGRAMQLRSQQFGQDVVDRSVSALETLQSANQFDPLAAGRENYLRQKRKEEEEEEKRKRSQAAAAAKKKRQQVTGGSRPFTRVN